VGVDSDDSGVGRDRRCDLQDRRDDRCAVTPRCGVRDPIGSRIPDPGSRIATALGYDLMPAIQS
jgi:hypothetical protein